MMAIPSPYMRLLIADVDGTLTAPDTVVRGFADRGGYHIHDAAGRHRHARSGRAPVRSSRDAAVGS
jgi:hypothetical protein